MGWSLIAMPRMGTATGAVVRRFHVQGSPRHATGDAADVGARLPLSPWTQHWPAPIRRLARSTGATATEGRCPGAIRGRGIEDESTAAEAFPRPHERVCDPDGHFAADRTFATARSGERAPSQRLAAPPRPRPTPDARAERQPTPAAAAAPAAQRSRPHRVPTRRPGSRGSSRSRRSRRTARRPRRARSRPRRPTP
jgi:hypothetical protein